MRGHRGARVLSKVELHRLESALSDDGGVPFRGCVAVRGCEAVIPSKRNWLRLAWVGLWALCGACSAIVDADPVAVLGEKPLTCTPGVVREGCYCVDGQTGSQQCNLGGGYDPCVCAPPANVGAAGKGGGKGR